MQEYLCIILYFIFITYPPLIVISFSCIYSILNRPTIFPLPEVVAKLVFGEMGEELLLGGQKVVPSKLLRAGFVFENENIEDSIRASL